MTTQGLKRQPLTLPIPLPGLLFLWSPRNQLPGSACRLTITCPPCDVHLRAAIVFACCSALATSHHLAPCLVCVQNVLKKRGLSHRGREAGGLGGGCAERNTHPWPSALAGTWGQGPRAATHPQATTASTVHETHLQATGPLWACPSLPLLPPPLWGLTASLPGHPGKQGRHLLRP